MPRTIVVLGARNLGGAIVDHFLEPAGRAAAVARARTPWTGSPSAAGWPCPPTRRTRTRCTGALDTARRSSAGSTSRQRRGRCAADASGPVRWRRSSRPPASRTSAAGRWQWPSRRSCSCPRASALRQRGGGRCAVTGGSSGGRSPGAGCGRPARSPPGRSSQAAAQELREEGIHGPCWPSMRRSSRPRPRRTPATAARGARRHAVDRRRGRLPGQQGPRAQTYELVVTPAGDRWVP